MEYLVFALTKNIWQKYTRKLADPVCVFFLTKFISYHLKSNGKILQLSSDVILCHLTIIDND